ncbi:nephrin-like isoform X2 [Centruroides vittatus]|nr:nephrin-like isoform X2 [Centruroides sculpturatus]XP_023221173.1 nephrin-like isoform X2 [Centruroides sculpturatus]
MGAVQWSKNGFVLGFDPDIPGYPRYSMIVDERRGVYNLRIRETRLEDEGEYQCQVGPAPFNHPIRAQARLTVLIPPQQLLLYHRDKRKEVRVVEAERYSIACFANNSKPASQLKWYRNDIPIREDLIPNEQKIVDDKLYTTISALQLYAILNDHGAVYTCEASHPALSSPIRSDLTINVLYPPGMPEIEGYHDGDVIQEGDTLTLACICRGGNPPANLLWYRNDVQVDDTFTANPKETTNVYTFTVISSDNNSMFRCDAISTITGHYRTKEVKLTVI